MSDSEDEFVDATAALTSDSEVDSEVPEDEALSGDEDADMPNLEDVVGVDEDEHMAGTSAAAIEVEKRKRKTKSASEKKAAAAAKKKAKLTKKARTLCSVPGCRSKYLIDIGVQLSSFSVPQPTSSDQSQEVWLKWIHALGYSSKEEASRMANTWARVCELHFSADCFVQEFRDYLPGRTERRLRPMRRLKPGSYPTLNVAVPEILLEDPRMIFHSDPLVSDANTRAGKVRPAAPEKPSAFDKVRMKAQILHETDAKVQQRVARDSIPSVIPTSLSNTVKTDYEKRVKELIAAYGADRPPAFIEELHRKLGISSSPQKVVLPAGKLPPFQIMWPMVKDGEAPQPAIIVPAADPTTAIKQLAKPEVQELIKSIGEKHKAYIPKEGGEPPPPAILLFGWDNDVALKLFEDAKVKDLLKQWEEKMKAYMAKRLVEEGLVDEGEEEEFMTETGEKVKRKKKAIPLPTMRILHIPTTKKKDIVQQALDRTFKSSGLRAIAPRPPPARQQFLESLPPMGATLILNEDGTIVAGSSGDHDYHGQGASGSGGEADRPGIPLFDPSGLRHEIDQWRMEVELLKRKNQELRLRLSESRINRKSSSGVGKSSFKGFEADRKRVEKLEAFNRKLQEEVVRLKLERRRMLNKERNRKRKRQKVLERRQKRRDWIMEQIALGNMTKEHLELVYSRKKLPYEKKGGEASNEQVTLITLPSTSQTANDMIRQQQLQHQRRGKQTMARVRAGNAGMAQVVLTTSETGEVQHHEITDENTIAIAGIPGVIISSTGLHGQTQQYIVEGAAGEEYTNEQIDLIVKAVDEMQAGGGWKVASPRHIQGQQF